MRGWQRMVVGLALPALTLGACAPAVYEQLPRAAPPSKFEVEVGAGAGVQITDHGEKAYKNFKDAFSPPIQTTTDVKDTSSTLGGSVAVGKDVTPNFDVLARVAADFRGRSEYTNTATAGVGTTSQTVLNVGDLKMDNFLTVGVVRVGPANHRFRIGGLAGLEHTRGDGVWFDKRIVNGIEQGGTSVGQKKGVWHFTYGATATADLFKRVAVQGTYRASKVETVRIPNPARAKHPLLKREISLELLVKLTQPTTSIPPPKPSPRKP